MSEKILVYGRNFHARAAFRRLLTASNTTTVLGFIDGATSTSDERFMTRPVYHLQQLDTVEFDAIILAGRYVPEMRATLLSHHVPADRIREMTRSEFQPSEASLARRSVQTTEILARLHDILVEHSIEYWAVASSLLALKRGQDLAWFADVDIAVPQPQLAELLHHTKASGAFYSVEHRCHTRGGAFWREGDICQIVVRSEADLVKSEPATLDIHVMYRHGGSVYCGIGPCAFLKSDEVHFSSHETHAHDGINLSVPLLPDLYLTSMYGDGWRTPSETFYASGHISRVEWHQIVRRVVEPGTRAESDPLPSWSPVRRCPPPCTAELTDS